MASTTYIKPAKPLISNSSGNKAQRLADIPPNLRLLIATGQNRGIVKDETDPTHWLPCNECGLPLFWSSISRGPLFCAACLPPPDKARVKRWRILVTVAGEPRLIDKAQEERAFRVYRETGIIDFDAAVEDGLEIVSKSPIPDGMSFDDWWASLAADTEAQFQKIDKKNGKKIPDQSPVRVRPDDRLWFITEKGSIVPAGKKVKDPVKFTFEGAKEWWPMSRFPGGYKFAEKSPRNQKPT